MALDEINMRGVILEKTLHPPVKIPHIQSLYHGCKVALLLIFDRCLHEVVARAQHHTQHHVEAHDQKCNDENEEPDRSHLIRAGRTDAADAGRVAGLAE